MPRTGELDAKLWPEVRGLVLRYIYRQERKRREIVFLRAWAFVRDDGYPITIEDLERVLEDLREQGLATYEKAEDAKTGAVRHQRIRTLGKGRNLVERTANDPSVRIELTGTNE